MESKINIHLCANYVKEDFKSAVINAILCEYIIDEVRLLIKRLSKYDLDLFHVHESFKEAIEKSKNVTFATISDWEDNKVSSYEDCLRIVAILDRLSADAGKSKAGEIIEEFRGKTQEYVVLLFASEIDLQHLDFGNLNIKQEFIDNVLHELKLVDEGQFLSDLGTMQMAMAPLDINKYRNKFIEQKLKRANNIALSVDSSLEREFMRLHNEIMGSYDSFYKIAHATLSDSEKVDASRKIIKLIPPHRKILDKLENKLTEANELKRQLTLHERRLKSDMVAKLQEFNARIQENPYEKEELDRESDALKFVTEEYLTKIAVTIDAINQIEEEIGERYKIIDRVEVALKSAIPTESEMKRYSSLGFKFEDLYVRLELAKSQIKNKDKDFASAINTAITGLGVLVNMSLEGKDLLMRNSLLSSVFNSVNGIYDLVDNKNKSIELTQIKFVTTRLMQYSMLNGTFTKDLQMFRHISNNVIRDIAIQMGKPFNLVTMLDIVDTIDLSITQLQELLDSLNKNHVEQTQLLGDIFNV